MSATSNFSRATSNFEDLEYKGNQNKAVPIPIPRRESTTCHQHQFTSLTPISSFKFYHNQKPFCAQLTGMSPLYSVKCDGCGMQFISVIEDKNITIDRRSSFDKTFAAYYNTSQLGASPSISQSWPQTFHDQISKYLYVLWKMKWMYIEINKHIMRNKMRESRHSAHMDVLIFYGIVTKTTKSFIYYKIKISIVEHLRGYSETTVLWW